MFGEPIRNTKGLPTTAFENVVKLQRGFDLPVQDRSGEGDVPVYGSNGVLGYHDEERVKSGGIITGRSGTIGKVYYTIDGYWPLNTTLFSVDLHGNNVVYLAHLIEFFKLERFVEGSGVPTLNRNIVHREQIIIVPLPLQERFADFVRQVDKSKFTVLMAVRNVRNLQGRVKICFLGGKPYDKF